MEAKSFWVWVQWESLDILNIILLLSRLNGLVQTTLRVSVSNSEDIFVQICLKNSSYQSLILIVSDSASIIDLGTDIVEHFVRHLFVVLNEDSQLLPANSQVFVHECILNVPSDWSELSSVLHNGVEEAETKQ